MNEDNGYESTVVTPPAGSGRKRNKKALVILLILAAIAACIVGYFFCRQSHTINLNQYLTIGYEGYEGYAEPVMQLDEQAIERDYGNKLHMPYGSTVTSDTKGVSDTVAAFCKRYTTDVTYAGYVSADNLSLGNGDIVTYHGFDKTVHDSDFGCWVRTASFEERARGIKQLNDADPFQGLILRVNGGNGEAVAEVDTDAVQEPFKYIDYQMSRSTYLSNGDTVRVTIPQEDLQWLADENHGYQPDKTFEDYTIKGLPALTKSNTLSSAQEEYERMKQEREAEKAEAEKKKAEKEKAGNNSYSTENNISDSGNGSSYSNGTYDDDVDPDDPDYEEGDEDFGEYDDIEYYDDNWEGDY